MIPKQERDRIINTLFEDIKDSNDGYDVLKQSYYIEECDDEEFVTSIFIHLFDFCSCGMLYFGTAKLMRDVLSCFSRERHCLDFASLHCKIEKEDVEDFILHFLDSHGLTEHGSSIYGSWLTEKGIILLEVLNECL